MKQFGKNRSLKKGDALAFLKSSPPVGKELGQNADKATEDKKQTRNEVSTRCQRDNNEVTTRCQRDNKSITKKSPKEERGNNEVSNEVTNEVTTRYQRGNNEVSNRRNVQEVVLSKTGIQKRILMLAFSRINNSGTLTTTPITKEDVEALGITYGSYKTSLVRLKKDNLIFTKGKGCRGGFTQITIPPHIYNIITSSGWGGSKQTNNEVTTRYQRGNNEVSNEVTNGVTNPSSSSSININTTNYTSGWENIDISSLSEIGFHEGHLKQIIEFGKSSPKLFNHSVEILLWILKNKPDLIKKTPLDFFVGILKKSGCLNPPSGFKSNAQVNEEKLKQEEEKIREEQKRRLNARREFIKKNYYSILKIPFFKNEKEILGKEELFDENDVAFIDRMEAIMFRNHDKINFEETKIQGVNIETQGEVRNLIESEIGDNNA